MLPEHKTPTYKPQMEQNCFLGLFLNLAAVGLLGFPRPRVTALWTLRAQCSTSSSQTSTSTRTTSRAASQEGAASSLCDWALA